jgi:hypothetical protein
MFVPKQQYAELIKSKADYLTPDTKVSMVPVPIQGWDAISPLAVMDPNYANILINWVPRTGWVELRGGYNAWSQGLGNPIETLMTYRPSTGAEKLFAAAGGSIFDVSLVGLYTTVQSGKNSARWQWAMFTPFGGANNLLAVNGSDAYLLYNGTTWSNPVITGVSASTLIHVNIFKRRVWFTQNSSTSAWFLGTDAIQGAATQLDIGALINKGGFLMAMATWTVDGGNGPDDYAVFISSRGQLVIYKGTDPTNANAFALIGVFDVGSPVGRRCFTRLGADVMLITLDGVIPLSQTLPFDPVSSRNVAVTNRIQNAMIQATFAYSANFGWEIMPFHQQSLVFLNIPQVTNSVQVQFVMNALTGAWCQFNGWNANCFGIYNESLYFGDNNGNVNLAYTAGLDLVSPIAADMRCAFNYFEQPGRLKQITMIRPFIIADGTLTPTIQVDADFITSNTAANVSILQPTGALWDSALWDVGIWSGGQVTSINWLSSLGLGTALAIRMKVSLIGGGASGQVAASSVFDTGVFDTMIFDGNGQVTQSGNGVPVLQVNAFETTYKYGGPI